MTLIRTAIIAAALCGLTAAPASAGPVQLRTPVEAVGAAVTLGDFFTDAGPAASRAVGPAPIPGRTAIFSARFVQAAAAAAGLEWTPPPGATTIPVTRASGAVITRSNDAPSSTAAVHRNDLILIVYSTPGVKLSMRAKALNDANVGETVRATNLASNRTVDAVVTGDGAATITPAGN